MRESAEILCLSSRPTAPAAPAVNSSKPAGPAPPTVAPSRHEAAAGLPPARLSRAERRRLWREAPAHDFPWRDAMLWQFSSLRRRLADAAPAAPLRIFEAGPGAGLAAHYLAARGCALTLADVSAAALARLQTHFSRRSAAPSFELLDLGAADLPARRRGAHDFAFALDMFEYVSDPARCLRNLARALGPGGELFVTFPNSPPPRGDAVCWFASEAELQSLLAQAGFARWEIFLIEPRLFARAVFAALHEAPLAVARVLRRFGRSRFAAAERPRAYEETWAFRHEDSLRRARLFAHAYWTALAWLLRRGGPFFRARPAAGSLLGRRVGLRAWVAGP